MGQRIFNANSVLGVAAGAKTSKVPMKKGPFALGITGTFVATIKILKKLPKYDQFATQDGGDGAALLTDSTLSLTADQLIGLWVENESDGSFAPVTDNADTTVTGTLIGGTQNDWDDGEKGSIWTEVAEYTTTDQTLERNSHADDEEYIAILSAWTSGTANVEFNQ